MAEEKIYILEIDTAGSEKRLAEVADELNKNNERIKELQAEQKKKGQLDKDQVTELARLRAGNRDLAVEQRNLIKLTKEGSDGQKVMSESTDALRARLNLALKAFDGLTKEQQENSEQGKRLKAQIDQLTASVSKSEQSTGRFQRGVGNYAGAIKGAVAGTGKFGQGLDAVGMALKGNPIFFLVGVLTSIVSAFKKSQPLVDFFSESMGGINAIIDTLVARAGRLVNGFQALFSGDFGKAAQEFKGAFQGIADETKRAYEFGVAYEKVLKRLSDEADMLAVVEAKNAAQIAQLNKQLRDRTRSEKERIAIAKQIQELEKNTFEQRDQLLRQEANLLRSDLRRLLVARGLTEEQARELDGLDLIQKAQDMQVNDDKFLKYKESLINIYNNEAASLGIIEGAQTRLNMIQEQSAEQNAKNQAKRQEQLAKEAALREKMAKEFEALSKAELSENLKAIDQAFKKEQQSLQQQMLAELNASDMTEKQVTAIKKKYADLQANSQATNLQRQINEMQDYAATVEGIDVMIADKQLELDNLVTQNKLKNFDDEYKVKKELADKALAEDKRRADIQKQAFLMASQNIGQAVEQSISQFEGDFDEFQRTLARNILTTTLDVIQKQLIAKQLAALAEVAIESAANPIQGLLVGGLKIAGITAAFAAGKLAINRALGFAEGGVIPSGHELPYSNNKGDNTPILAKAGEMVLNKGQQARIKAMAGADVFGRAGVPGANTSGGFAGGGVVPMPINVNAALLDAIQNLSLQVSVSEINAVQNRVAVRDQMRRL